jgi:S-adenosylmethionine uptake transporter
MNNYFTGICWFLLSLLTSSINDLAAKFLGQNLPFEIVAFHRFFFGTLTLVPFIFLKGSKEFHTTRPYLHIIRGSILYCAISIWVYCLNLVPIVTATLATFTIPLFLLILAPIFLREKVSNALKIATIVGFIGIIIAYKPTDISFKFATFGLLISSLLFASLDILNKKFVSKESMISMLFYSGLVTTCLSIIPAVNNWQTPSFHDYIVLLYLGIGSNLILFFLLKAFSCVKATDVAPYRYLELVLSGTFGFIYFYEVPDSAFILGSLFVIGSTLYIAYKQNESTSH